MIVLQKNNIKEHNSNWPEVLDHPYRILIIGGSGSGKTNALFNLINNEPDIDKIYLYIKDLYEAKYWLLINERENTDLEYFIDSKAFIEYLKDIDDIYKNIEEYNPHKKQKILIVFDDMIADMLCNKKLNPIVTKLFIGGSKLYISLVFTTHSFFTFEKNIRLNLTHYFVMNIPNKRESQQIAINHSSAINFYNFMNLYKNCAEKYILFWLLILLLHQITLYVSEKIYWKEYKSLSWKLMIKLKMKNCNTILTEKQQNISIIIR